MKFTNSEEFEESVVPVAGSTHIRPARGARFNADLQLFRFDNIGLFTIRANSFHVTIQPPHDFFSINIPLNLPFNIQHKGNQRLIAPGDAYLLHCNDQLNLTAADGCQLLVATFFTAPIQDYIGRLTQSDVNMDFAVNLHFSLATPSGIFLQRTLAQAWTKVHYDKITPVSELWLKELEDELITSFIDAIDTNKYDKHSSGEVLPAYMKIAEDYLCANLETPVTRARLAEESGVSMRTLSRAFFKRYGMGPIGFLKQRRLDAAYRTLLGTESGTTTVTDTALRYGFLHMGKFAIEYRQAFGETPSTSLSR
jgi:AraC-like DNA-binding protein